MTDLNIEAREEDDVKKKAKHKWVLSPVKAFGVYDWYTCSACKDGAYHNRGKHKVK